MGKVWSCPRVRRGSFLGLKKLVLVKYPAAWLQDQLPQRERNLEQRLPDEGENSRFY